MKYADKLRRTTNREYKIMDTVMLHQKKTTTKPPYELNPYTVTQMRGTQITATRKNKEVTRNVDKWKILKKRPSHLSNLTDSGSHVAEQSDSDDNFNLPRTGSAI